MAIPKRVWSNNRIVWHDKKYIVYLKDWKLQYQDEKWLWHEVWATDYMTRDELTALESAEAIVAELNKDALGYLEYLKWINHAGEVSEWWVMIAVLVDGENPTIYVKYDNTYGLLLEGEVGIPLNTWLPSPINW